MRNLKKVLSITAAAAMVMATMAPVSVFAEDETFKIGVIGPMTGDYAQYGLGVYHAAQVAAEEINANGGFNGYNVEILDAGDDQGDPEKAVNAYNDLLDKGMQMLCGTVTSGSCIAVGAEAAESTFMFTPSATAIDSITSGDNEFRMCFTDPAQGTKSAQYIGEHKLATKVAVLYDSMADYNSGVHDAFVAAAEDNGLEVVAALWQKGLLDTIVIVTQYEEIIYDMEAHFPYMKTVNHPHPEAGISGSIRLGVEKLIELEEKCGKTGSRKREGCMFAVADQPYLTRESLENMVETWEVSKKGILVSENAGRMGNPVIFAYKYYEELKKLEGDVGGKCVLKKHLDDVQMFEMPASELKDLDLLTEIHE